MLEQKLDFSKICDIEVDGVDYRDYPDFSDAYICRAFIMMDDSTYREATDEEIEEMNEDSQFVYECVESSLY